MKQLLTLFLLFSVGYVSRAQIISTIAGNGFSAYTGDGGPATAASINNPLGVAVDGAGNVYIVDTKNHCIRKVNSAGIISTIAGNGTAGYSGDGGPATAAKLYIPNKIVLDVAGNILFVDNGNFCIRKIDAGGIISTIAGTGVAGNSGDGGPATAAQVNGSPGLAIDAAGNIYFSDVTKNTIRKINTSGIVSTIAGCGLSGYMGDGGPATAARFNEPFGIAVDGTGNIYVAEYSNNCLRKISASGVVSTVTGALVAGYSGDGGPASIAKLDRPASVVVDKNGNIYIGDHNNHVIRRISNTGIITTIAGTGVSGYSGDGGPATAATFRGPSDVCIDAMGSLLIADYGNSVIRRVNNVVTVPFDPVLQDADMRVFPNPSSGRFSVRVSTMESCSMSIVVTDLLGRQVLTLSASTNTDVPIDMNVANGWYVVAAIVDSRVLSEKMYLVR
ncbi:MAG: SMP-30/gluconolactonase/LRE family protein [Chitinophagaceae bacterium]|nr:SMP-30/gluconolactonase/LRE family protein [Chitinophagaceae bacterium]